MEKQIETFRKNVPFNSARRFVRESLTSSATTFGRHGCACVDIVTALTITMVAVFIFRVNAPPQVSTSRVRRSRLLPSPSLSPLTINNPSGRYIEAVSIEFRRHRHLQSIWPTDGGFRNVPEFGSVYVISSNVLYADAFPDDVSRLTITGEVACAEICTQGLAIRTYVIQNHNEKLTCQFQ